MYLDEKGLIVQRDGDGGDTLQREGFWYEGMFLNPNYPPDPKMALYKNALAILQTPNGFIRNWNQWTDPKDCSRDQLQSNVRACGYNPSLKDTVRFILKSVVKNFSRFPNGDIAFVNDYGRFIRALDAWYLWPLLLVCDTPLIVNSIIRCIKGRNYDDVGDDVNHIGDLAQCQYNLPTPVSWIARKIYVWFRPSYAMVAVGVVKANGPGAIWALNWYFRSASNANPEFIDLWTPVVKRF